MKVTLKGIIMISAIFLLYSCASTGYNTQKGAAIGAGVGAIVGQAIGKNTTGTLIGTAGGALIGSIIGNIHDQHQMQELAASIKDRSAAEKEKIVSSFEECPPGEWVEVPGKWVGGKWVPKHRVWVPIDP